MIRGNHLTHPCLLPPDTEADHLGAVIARAETNVAVIDRGSPKSTAFDLTVCVACAPSMACRLSHRVAGLTLGTISVPKMVMHDLIWMSPPTILRPAARRSRSEFTRSVAPATGCFARSGSELSGPVNGG